MKKNDPSPEQTPDEEPPIILAANLRGDDTPDQTGAVKKKLFIFGPGWCDPNDPPK
jgi:hypothetical protein